MKKTIGIPDKRISVVRRNLDELEEKTEVKIVLERGHVQLEGEALKVWKAKDIVDAIVKGFSFEKSLKLLSEKNQLKIVRLKEAASSRNSIDKIKGRIIGRDGRTRELIEKYSKALVSVHGDTVSIIGTPQEISVASKAVEMLVSGSPHARVYHYLEQNQPKSRKR